MLTSHGFSMSLMSYPLTHLSWPDVFILMLPPFAIFYCFIHSHTVLWLSFRSSYRYGLQATFPLHSTLTLPAQLWLLQSGWPLLFHSVWLCSEGGASAMLRSTASVAFGACRKSVPVQCTFGYYVSLSWGGVLVAVFCLEMCSIILLPQDSGQFILPVPSVLFFPGEFTGPSVQSSCSVQGQWCNDCFHPSLDTWCGIDIREPT